MADALDDIYKSLAYYEGDTSITNIRCGVFGYISYGGNGLYLMVPLRKVIPASLKSKIKCTSATDGYLRGRNGYVGDAGMDFTPYIAGMEYIENVPHIVFEKSDGWGETNNKPVTGTIKLTVRFG